MADGAWSADYWSPDYWSGDYWGGASEATTRRTGMMRMVIPREDDLIRLLMIGAALAATEEDWPC